MEQDRTVDLALKDLIDNRLVAAKSYWQVRPYLLQVWCSGFDESKLAKKKTILQFTLSGDRVAEYPSAAAAARKYNVNKSSIASAARGRYKTACGFFWRYKD